MPTVLWDASGLVKRYGRETGSETVDAIFQSSAVDQMATTIWGCQVTASDVTAIMAGTIL